MDFPQVEAIKEAIKKDIALTDDRVKTFDQSIEKLIYERETFLLSRDKSYKELKLIDEVIALVNQQLEADSGHVDLADSLDDDNPQLQISDTPYLSDGDW